MPGDATRASFADYLQDLLLRGLVNIKKYKIPKKFGTIHPAQITLLTFECSPKNVIK